MAALRTLGAAHPQAGWTPKQRVLHYRRQITEQQDDWQASLAVLGRCSYGGPIPLAAVTKNTLIDYQKQKFLRLRNAYR